jgi:hypothetical protein
MGRLGFEPRTNQLKAEYSTVELTTHVFFAQNVFIAHYRNLEQAFLRIFA